MYDFVWHFFFFFCNSESFDFSRKTYGKKNWAKSDLSSTYSFFVRKKFVK